MESCNLFYASTYLNHGACSSCFDQFDVQAVMGKLVNSKHENRHNL